MHVDIIRDAVQRRPFVPFSLKLADGRTIRVQYPVHVAISKRVVVVVGHKKPTFTFMESLLIVSIDYENAKGIELPRTPKRRTEEAEEFGSPES